MTDDDLDEIMGEYVGTGSAERLPDLIAEVRRLRAELVERDERIDLLAQAAAARGFAIRRTQRLPGGRDGLVSGRGRLSDGARLRAVQASGGGVAMSRCPKFFTAKDYRDHLPCDACEPRPAEERIVEIAKAMREAWHATPSMPNDAEWLEMAWLAAAAQDARMLGREDVIPSVGPESWMAPVFGEGAKR